MSGRWLDAVVLCLTVGAALANAWLGANPLFGATALAFCVLFHSVTLGARLVRRPHGLAPTALGFLTIIAGQSVIQTAFYYLGLELNAITDAASLGLFLIFLIGVLHEHTDVEPEYEVATITPSWPWVIALAIPSLIAFGYVLKASSGVATDASIRTPWPLLPVGVLAACAVPALAAWLAAWKTRSRVCVAAFAALAILCVTLIAPLVYSVGYGFDGFLHQASEKILLETGTLSPQPPYYIGQYVFVTWLARLTQLDVAGLDRFLVPLFAACLPFLFVRLMKREDALPAAALLFLPFAAFVATTPQSFAYVIGLMAVLAALSGQYHRLTPLTLAAWAIAIHPLAGLPLAVGMLALLIPKKTRQQEILRWLLVLIAVVSIPTAFALLNSSQASVSWDFARLVDPQTFSTFFSSLVPPRNRVALWADWASLVVFLMPWAMLAASAYAIKRDEARRKEWLVLVVLGLGLTLAGWFLKAAGEFAFLIDYERGNFAERLFLVGMLFWIVPAAVGMSRLVSQARKGHTLGMAAILIGIFAWQSAQAYVALPRFDAAVASHGWSVGRGDVEAVRWMDHDAGAESYTVLANQSVSAAAVKELGFKRYADDSVFFYPIPTGGPLYQIFLRAVGTESELDTIKEAAKLGQSKIVYVVLNKYWWNEAKVADALASFAQEQQAFDGGNVRVFKYEVR